MEPQLGHRLKDSAVEENESSRQSVNVVRKSHGNSIFLWAGAFSGCRRYVYELRTMISDFSFKKK